MQLTSNRVAFAGTHLCRAAWGRVYCTPFFLTLLSSQGGLAVAQSSPPMLSQCSLPCCSQLSVPQTPPSSLQGGLAVAQIIASSSNFHRMIPELSKRCVLGQGSAATDP